MKTLNKDMLIELGGKFWKGGENERVYIKAAIFNKLYDVNFGDGNNTFYFDCKTEKMMRSYKRKRFFEVTADIESA